MIEEQRGREGCWEGLQGLSATNRESMQFFRVCKTHDGWPLRKQQRTLAKLTLFDLLRSKCLYQIVFECTD